MTDTEIPKADGVERDGPWTKTAKLFEARDPDQSTVGGPSI